MTCLFKLATVSGLLQATPFAPLTSLLERGARDERSLR